MGKVELVSRKDAKTQSMGCWMLCERWGRDWDEGKEDDDSLAREWDLGWREQDGAWVG